MFFLFSLAIPRLVTAGKRYKDETDCPVVILTTDENNEKQ